VIEPLVDSFGRVHRDLRISITDRCNFRCGYCMPEEGMAWLPRSEVLSYEEIERVARVLVERFGFPSIRLTGGEPTVRAHLPVLVAKLAALRVGGPGGEPVEVAMTTNGATLALVAEDLAAAGLGRVNVSLDSLRPDRFKALTRRDSLDAVLRGIDAALAAGLGPLRVNTVMMRGVNDDEAVELATFGRQRGVTVRFIEYMPLDADGTWGRSQVVPGQEILAAIGEVYPLERAGHLDGGHEPAETWRYRDGQGEVGVISSVTEPFCGSCDRVRLTADGQLRSCLFSLEEFDMRALLRSGAGDDEVAGLLRTAVSRKWAGHHIGQAAVFVRPKRSMSQIGG
jgi:cyclic pyranopterin phosphate synthase